MTHSEFNFRCQMYVAANQTMNFILPDENGPKRVARLEPLHYEELVDPGFRRLLAAFDSVPQPLPIVQV